jgi:hypothetical protein
LKIVAWAKELLRDHPMRTKFHADEFQFILEIMLKEREK